MVTAHNLIYCILSLGVATAAIDDLLTLDQSHEDGQSNVPPPLPHMESRLLEPYMVLCILSKAQPHRIYLMHQVLILEERYFCPFCGADPRTR